MIGHEKSRKVLWQRNGLKIYTKLKANKQLKTRTKLKPMSEKQTIKTEQWNKITDEVFEENGKICLWCGKPAKREKVDGHHIIPRCYNDHSKANNYPVHRFGCHTEITDKNIDVRKYKNKIAWENRNAEVK
ncbi:MAG: HNH endonuclease signature motif containing protein [Lutibacter sp.]|jgi:5-methylcytosine-specific restriction endonuclease McrA